MSSIKEQYDDRQRDGPRYSDKEKRWRRAYDDAPPSARRRRRYKCSLCETEKVVRMCSPADNYAHRGINCAGCDEQTPHYPLGARTLEAIRRKGRREL
jgi:ribosomal protein L37AE/L43A